MSSTYKIEKLSWQAAQQSQLKLIREQVFIIEQKVPLSIEWDEYDADAIHLLAIDNLGNPIGCARVLKHGKIGRMAVLSQWRGKGVGEALLNQAIAECKKLSLKQIKISSQTHAIKFYTKAGFLVISDAYIDANIWHVDMVLTI